jgi:Fur family peroxide stress response transcriptional regulator
MRYDAIHEKHHHLYCAESDRIEDYYDPDLDALLEGYFKKKNIPEFNVSEFKLQISGKFNSGKDQNKQE